jgi:enamine deaminase RidA (YjgF/YER057c/UK114 family)
MKVIEPPGWPRGAGYSHGVAAAGTLVFVSGQIGWDEKQQLAGDDLPGQAKAALSNIVSIVAAAGGTPDSIVRMTWYVVDKDDYIAKRRAIGEAYRAVMGRHFPSMSVVEVSRLVEDGALVEIEATAVLSS